MKEININIPIGDLVIIEMLLYKDNRESLRATRKKITELLDKELLGEKENEKR